MAQCPSCDKEIDRLIHRHKGTQERLYILENGIVRIEQIDFHSDELDYFLCPACKQTIIYNEEIAESFLQGTYKPSKVRV